MEASPPNQRIQFEHFEADVNSGELYRHWQKVRLERLPFQVLALLLEQPGQLVTRDQLHRKLLATDTFVDFEAGLNTTIRKLREALGASRGTPRFIETSPAGGTASSPQYRSLPTSRARRNSPRPLVSPRRLSQRRGIHASERSGQRRSVWRCSRSGLVVGASRSGVRGQLRRRLMTGR